MGYRKYSESEKAEALIKLAFNKYDYQKTSDDTNISVKTLRRWDKDVPKKGVIDLLERALERILMAIPGDLKGTSWATAFGILFDKWLLGHGKATSRHENITTWLQNIPDDELDELIAQFTEAANRPVTIESREGKEEPGAS